ncbi:hypothetical protein H0H93_007151 [Arthromyces matolae]|nr:hypothetical protein H0H93_007151 [Arthromyces matolae]
MPRPAGHAVQPSITFIYKTCDNRLCELLRLVRVAQGMKFDIGLLGAFACLGLLLGTAAQQRDSDPCTVIAGQKWVAPKDVRDCYSSIQVDPAIRENIIDVITKSLAFHTSVNYQIKAPEPFTSDVHEDVLADLATYRTKHYSSDYALHVDLSRALKRLNDAAFINYLPTPLTLLTAPDGSQSVYIAPEAFDIASVEFADQIQFWQDSLPGPLRGQLQTLSGAKVLLINGHPPLDAVNQNAAIAGSFQALGTRQNGFFSSYSLTATGWTYVLGNFAQQALPLSDSVTLTIRRLNQSETDTIVLPYRSRIGAINSFTNKSTFLANNCVAVDGTNGIDYYASAASAADSTDSPIIKFQQQPPIPAAVARKHPVNVILDDTPVTDVLLPPTLTPSLPTATGSRAAAQFYLLKDGKTGVLALGSFSDSDYIAFLDSLLAGLVSLKSQGATQLIVDVIAGPKSTTVPQAGLYTQARDGPLAQLIVGQIVNGNVSDPNVELLYNPLQWTNGSNAPFTATDNWLQPPVKRTVNGHQDAFSPRLGQECQPNGFPEDAPEFALFNSSKVVIVSNGRYGRYALFLETNFHPKLSRCASSCSLFSITMAKEEGVRTVVVGGNSGVTQQYCGTVGDHASQKQFPSPT